MKDYHKERDAIREAFQINICDWYDLGFRIDYENALYRMLRSGLSAADIKNAPAMELLCFRGCGSGFLDKLSSAGMWNDDRPAAEIKESKEAKRARYLRSIILKHTEELVELASK